MRNKILIYLVLSAVVTGLTPTIASAGTGSIVGWGYNDFGQATPPAGNDFVVISAGVYHSLALKSDGSIVGWGGNDYGQANPPAETDFVAIAAGAFHSLALKSDGSIVAWGWNNYGQVTPPAGNDFVVISAGGYHSLALKSDGSIVGWGSNIDPWSGPGSPSGQASPPAGNDFVAIAAGYYHSLALKLDGSIVAWGWNGYGQAIPPAGNNFIAIAAGEHQSLALKSDGSIVGWGYNDHGEAIPPAGNNFVAIVAGAFHSLALCKVSVEIDVDIKPGSCPNPLNVKSKGVLPVAVLGTAEFDVTAIDLASIRLAGVAPIRSNFEDVATPADGGECECTTAGPDGCIDLSLKFNTQDIVNALGEVADGEVLEVALTGELLDGTAIEGSDCIVIIAKARK